MGKGNLLEVGKDEAMTSRVDILGRKPCRKKPVQDDEIEITGPSFEELCKPVSASTIPARVLAMSDGNPRGAMKSQRMEGRR